MHIHMHYIYPHFVEEKTEIQRGEGAQIANGRAEIWLQTWLNCKAHSFFHFIIYMFSTKKVKGSELFKENEREDSYMKIFIGMCIVNVNKWF